MTELSWLVLQVLSKKIKQYWEDEGGQTSIEYILLLVVVAAIIFKFKDELNNRITGLLNRVFGEKLDRLLDDQ